MPLNEKHVLPALLVVHQFLASCERPVPREHALCVLSESKAIGNRAILALSIRVGVDDRGNRDGSDSGMFGPNVIDVDAMKRPTLFATETDIKILMDIGHILSAL
jgi:hypothetical protein